MIPGRLLRPLGWLVASVAGAYFLRYAWRSLADKDLSSLLEPRVVAATVVLCALYMLLIPVTALAWTWLLRGMGEHARFGCLLPILATTQFGKYLPGNVAQHIGRVALLRTTQISLSSAVLSVAYEMILVLVACAHLSALTLLWALPPGLAQWPLFAHRELLLLAVTFGAFIALALAPRLARWLTTLKKQPTQVEVDGATPPTQALRWGAAVKSYALYAVNFVLVGAGMHLVAAALAVPAGGIPGVAYLTGAFASSWVLGFIAPGAPAGLGVREVILSAWLAAAMPADRAVTMVIALRIATTLGDVLNFGAGSLALRRSGALQRSS